MGFFGVWKGITRRFVVVSVLLPVFVLPGYLRSVPFGAHRNESRDSAVGRGGGRSVPGNGLFVLAAIPKRILPNQSEEVRCVLRCGLLKGNGT